MRAPTKAKPKTKKTSGRALPSRSTRRGPDDVPSWAVTTVEERKELDDTMRRVLDGSEKLTRILL